MEFCGHSGLFVFVAVTERKTFRVQGHEIVEESLWFVQVFVEGAAVTFGIEKSEGDVRSSQTRRWTYLSGLSLTGLQGNGGVAVGFLSLIQSARSSTAQSQPWSHQSGLVGLDENQAAPVWLLVKTNKHRSSS